MKKTKGMFMYLSREDIIETLNIIAEYEGYPMPDIYELEHNGIRHRALSYLLNIGILEIREKRVFLVYDYSIAIQLIENIDDMEGI